MQVAIVVDWIIQYVKLSYKFLAVRYVFRHRQATISV